MAIFFFFFLSFHLFAWRVFVCLVFSRGVFSAKKDEIEQSGYHTSIPFVKENLPDPEDTREIE